MSIASGYRKFNRFMKQADGTYIKMSHWTSSNTVHFDDGSTVQANLGAIKGITSDLACEDTNVAASMPAVSAKLTELNNGIINTKSYFFGGRTYATYLSADLVMRSIQLPDAFKEIDVNNFYVSVIPEYTNGNHVDKPFIQKATGTFNVVFKNDDETFNENSAVWFDYIVIINH